MAALVLLLPSNVLAVAIFNVACSKMRLISVTARFTIISETEWEKGRRGQKRAEEGRREKKRVNFSHHHTIDLSDCI